LHPWPFQSLKGLNIIGARVDRKTKIQNSL
jgi:hypothetical protein